MDAWLHNADFCKGYFGKKELVVKYYERALRYLREHPLPSMLSPAERDRYNELKDIKLLQLINTTRVELERAE